MNQKKETKTLPFLSNPFELATIIVIAGIIFAVLYGIFIYETDPRIEKPMPQSSKGNINDDL